jgi:hypothetical protein
VQTGLASATQNIHNSSRSVVTPTEIVRDVLKYHIYHCSVLPPFIPQGSTDDLRSKTTSALCLSSYVECILPNPFLDAIRDGRERPRTNRPADSMFARGTPHQSSVAMAHIGKNGGVAVSVSAIYWAIDQCCFPQTLPPSQAYTGLSYN